ncbi:amino acid ABC transporter permease [Dethiosulfovibrio sp. F2B]|uniref:amino acid ABC transporter permease n=1 Tax=Dethiosulfovibrio faecalis TaxID=2720018 RepID=UPI001F283FA0|nr:amino acid ABC transporter permease [Dethiosulfovibrio faecalis]
MGGFQLGLIWSNGPALLNALCVTVYVSLVSYALAFMVGVVVGVLRWRPGPFEWLLSLYVEFFRGTPLLIQLFFIYYGLPSLGISLPRLGAAFVGLGLNGGAYISEIVRGGLMSVSSGQEEACKVLGLGTLQALRFVILPQAFRVSIPSLVNSFSSLLKDSSLVSVLAITEIARMGQLIYTRTFRPFEVYLSVAIIYFVLTRLVSWMAKSIEKRLAV